jgi:hypothetical protein
VAVALAGDFKLQNRGLASQIKGGIEISLMSLRRGDLKTKRRRLLSGVNKVDVKMSKFSSFSSRGESRT